MIVKIKPTLTAISIDENSIWLTPEERKDTEALKEYIDQYYTHYGYEVESIESS